VGVPLASKQLHQTISEFIIKQSTEDCRALLQQVSFRLILSQVISILILSAVHSSG